VEVSCTWQVGGVQGVPVAPAAAAAQLILQVELVGQTLAGSFSPKVICRPFRERELKSWYNLHPEPLGIADRSLIGHNSS